MAPRVQPRSFYRLCLSLVTGLIEQACTRMFLEHGVYDDPSCLEAIARLQSHLMQLLPLTVFQDLADRCRSGKHNHTLPTAIGAIYPREVFTWISDPRIKNALFIHPCVTKLNVDRVLLHDYDQYLGDEVDEIFWSSQLRRLMNITHLRLNLLSTNEILRLVGDSCPNLECVHISCSIQQDVDHSTDPYMPRFTYNIRVTDAGLQELLKCSNLRRVVLDSIINTNLTGLVTVAGARHLVFGLPNLEFVNFISMGKILQEKMQHDGTDDWRRPLKLVNFRETELCCVDFLKLQHLLPNLRHVSLTVYPQMTPSGDISPQPTYCSGIMEALCTSSIRLNTIKLLSFPLCESMKKFLRTKGDLLEEFVYSASATMNSEEIFFLGQCCANLRRLTLMNVGPESRGHMPVNHAFLRRNPVFRHLTYLYLSGERWNANAIFPVALSSAFQIECLRFSNGGRQTLMDGSFTNLMNSNKLECLREIRFITGCLLTSSLIRRLSYNLPQLSHISAVLSGYLDVNEFELLRTELESQNYDINLELMDG